jgi:hypothetical protein
MKITAALFVISAFAMAAVTMKVPSKNAPTSFADLAGQYAGDGMCHGQDAQKRVHATLEIRADGTYTLAHDYKSNGSESGTWVRRANELQLSRTPNSPATKTGIATKPWKIVDGFTEVRYEDGTINFRLVRKS